MIFCNATDVEWIFNAMPYFLLIATFFNFSFKECEATVVFKTDLCDKLEDKVVQSDRTLKFMEEKYVTN